MPQSVDRFEYAHTIESVREAIRRVVPAGSGALVISRGDERLLDVDQQRRAYHFPACENGDYAGYYPLTGTEAAFWLLRAVTQTKAAFLVIPSSSAWWLDHYPETQFLLASSQEPIWRDENCSIYELIQPTARHPGIAGEPLGIDLPQGAVALAHAASSVMMDAGELLHLAAAAARVSWKEGLIGVEIGAYHGQTTAFLASVLQLLGRDVPVLSIDPFEQVDPDPLNPQGSYTEYLRSIQAAGAQKMCFPLVAFSQDAAAVVPHGIGLLIIDGWHEYSAVAQDLALYAPKVVPGGIIFMDDYGYSYPGVIQAADEFFTGKCPFKIIHKSHFLIAQRNAPKGMIRSVMPRSNLRKNQSRSQATRART